jgi:NitT/TauT family transport system permease protein
VSEDLLVATTDARSEPSGARPLSRGRRSLPVLLIVVLIAVAWEGTKALFSLPDYKLPHLLAIFAQFGERTQGGSGPIWAVSMLQNAGVTFGEALSGFVLGGLFGCALAILFAASPLFERGLLPYVVGSQTVPILAIAPMVVIALGRLGAPDWLPKAVVAAYLTFFPVTIGMLRGLRSASAESLDLMRSYAATSTQIFTKLRLPTALPYLFTSLKVAATASVVGAIVAELPAGSRQGIGVVILNATQYYNSNPPMLYATVLVAGAVGLCFYGLVVVAERLAVGEQRLKDAG